MRKLSSILLLFVAMLVFPAMAQDEVPGETKGPAKVSIGDNLAQIDLPEGYIFYDASITKDLLTRAGNIPDGNELGCVFLDSDKESFWVVIAFEDIGYVKDDDAGDIDADSLLKDFKAGTEAANEERKKQGVSPVELVGWGEEPRYDAQVHHLVWALRGKSDDGEVVNFNTRILGRKGVLSLNLICDPADLDRYKPKIDTLLKKTSYVEGQRYADFQEGDTVSEAGLLALIAGGAAAAKLGLFAKLGKLLLYILIAGKKFIILIFAAIWGFFQKLAGRKPKESVKDSPGISEGGEEKKPE